MSTELVRFRVYFYTEGDGMVAWETARTKQEEQGLRRKMKNGYAKIERII